jgi:uncharacterized protein YndB with AHSA1/START domain
MARIVSAIDIEAPIERVFDHATTAGNWPGWHPASLAVSGASDHSAAPGERLTEDIRAAGRRWRALWTVREREPPVRWVIEGRADGGGSATITYHLQDRQGGTRFERELVYELPNAFWALLDRLIIRRRMAAQSAEALRRLKRILESTAPPT